MDAGHDHTEGNVGLASRFCSEEPTFQHKRRVSPSPPRYAREPNLPIRKKMQFRYSRDDREDFVILGDQSKFRLNMIPYRVRSYSAPKYSDSTDMLTWFAGDDDDAKIHSHHGDYYNAYSLHHHGDGQSRTRDVTWHEGDNSNNNDVVNNTKNIDDDSTSDVSDRNARRTANVKVLPSKSIKKVQLQAETSAKQKPNKAAFAGSRGQNAALSGSKVGRKPIRIGAKSSGSGHLSRSSLNRSKNVTASITNSGAINSLKTKDKNNYTGGELLSRSDVGKFLADRHREKIKSDKMKAKHKDDAHEISLENENRNPTNQKAAPVVHYEENEGETKKKSDESLGEMIVNRSNDNRNNAAAGQIATDHHNPNSLHHVARSEKRHHQRTMSEYQNEFQWTGNQNKSAVIHESSTLSQNHSLNKSLPTLSWLSFDKEPRDLHSEYQDQFRPKSAIDFDDHHHSSSLHRPHRHHHHHHHHNVIGQRYYDDEDDNVSGGKKVKKPSLHKTVNNYRKNVHQADDDDVDVEGDRGRIVDVPSHNGEGKADENDGSNDDDASSSLNVNHLVLTDKMKDHPLNQNSHNDLRHVHHHRNRSEYEVKFVSPAKYRFVNGVWKRAGEQCCNEDLILNRTNPRDMFKSEYAREYVDKSKTLHFENDNISTKFDSHNSYNIDSSIKGDSKVSQRPIGLIQNSSYNEVANDATSELKNNHSNQSHNVFHGLDDTGNSFNKTNNNFNGIGSKFNNMLSNENNVQNTFVNSTVPSKPQGKDWFDHILELRRKADEYRSRGFGTTFSRDHLAQLRSDNLHFWDASSSDESLEQQYETRMENGRNGNKKRTFHSSQNGDLMIQHNHHLDRKVNNKAKQTLKSHNNGDDGDHSSGFNHHDFGTHNNHIHSRNLLPGGEPNYPSAKSVNIARNSGSHKVDFAPKTGFNSDTSNLSDSLSSSLSLAEEVLERARSRKKRLLSTK